MTTAKNVTATFNRIPSVLLSVTKTGTGGGRVTSIPGGINCGADCSSSYRVGTSITLRARPARDSIFAGWTGACTTAADTCTVEMTAAKAVVARFDERPPVVLSVIKAGDGTGLVISTPPGINCGTDCTASFRRRDEGARGRGDDEDEFSQPRRIVLRATASSDSTFVGWSGACSGTDRRCVVDLAESASVVATFRLQAQQSFPLTVTTTGSGSVTSSPLGINCPAACTASFTSGTVVTLNAAPNANATFTGWSGACTGTGSCVVTVNAATSVTATFVLNQYTLTTARTGTGTGAITSSPAGIACGVDCSETFAAGTVVSLTATPDATSTFAGWSGACTGTGSCVVTVNAVTSVTATFTLNQYTLTTARAGTGTGAITSSPANIACGIDCSYAFDAGTVVSLTATPDATSTFAGWSGACTGTGSCVVTVNAATSVTATFVLNRYALTTTVSGAFGWIFSEPTGIDCGADCAETYDAGTTVTLLASGTPSTTFTGWSGACTGTGGCSVTMDAAKSVTATYTLNEYALTAVRAGTGTGVVTSSPAGIDCGVDCSELFSAGSGVTLTATPDANSTFAGWSGGCLSGTDECVITIVSSTTAIATFTANPFTLSTSVAGTGSGIIASSPAGINCGVDCSEAITPGTVVTLTATSNATSTFTGWSGACSGTGTCVVTMDAAKSVTATFAIRRYTLNVPRIGAGTVTSSPAGINCGVDCVEDYDAGTVVTLTPAPDAASSFAGWSGACSGTAACAVTMDAAKSVTATFVANQFALSVTRSGSGSGAVSSSPAGITCGLDCSEIYNASTVVSLTATSDASSTFTGWSGACTGTGSCVVTMTAAKSVDAAFTIRPNIWTPQTSGSTKKLQSVDFISPTQGWAVGDGDFSVGEVGRIYGTTDGGATWTKQLSSFAGQVMGVDFVDASHGWAAGGYGFAYRTSDGGATWTQSSMGTGNFIWDVAFADLTHGWAVGNAGTIMSTSDGGLTWTAQSSGAPSYDCFHVDAVSATKVWVSCFGGLALTTNNGGTNWTAVFPFGNNYNFTLTSVDFIDDQQGWISSSFDIRKTTDGGLTWTALPASQLWSISDIVRTDALHGWAIGAGGFTPNQYAMIAATSDGGQTWTTQVTQSNGYPALRGGAFADGNHGWAVGENGTVLAYGPDSGFRDLTVSRTGSGAGSVTSAPATINCGATCAGSFPTNTVVTLTATAAAGSAFTGWSGACAGTGACVVTLDISKAVVATFVPTYTLTISVGGTGAGAVTSAPAGISCGLTCAASVAAGTKVTLTATPAAGSWFAGWSGACNTTAFVCTVVVNAPATATAIFNDGPPPAPFSYISGTWTPQVSGTSKQLTGVDFVNTDQGWAVGYGDFSVSEIGQILSTGNGGTTWTKQFSSTVGVIQAVDAVDALHVWATGGNGYVYRTSTGGVGGDWTQQTTPTTNYLWDIAFADLNHGWAVGNFGTVIGTVDGGDHWTVQPVFTSADCFHVDAVSATTAWVSCSSGIAYKTNDGGATWTSVLPFGNSYNFALTSVDFIDDQQGWISSYYDIRKTTDGGLTWTALPASPLWRTADIVRTDALHGWVIGSGGSSPNDYAMVAATADGGQTWTLQVNQANGFKPLAAGAFSDGNHGSAVGPNGTILTYGP